MLWKCWRDLRITFFVGLGWLALLAVGALWNLLRGAGISHTVVATPDQAFKVVVVYFSIQTFFFTILALSMGTFGVGRDLGNGAGSFLLTRPIPRAYFVWTEWFSGLLALSALLLLSILGLWLAIRCHAFGAVYFTHSGEPPTPHTWTLASLPTGAAAIDVLCAFLFVALVFALTHLGTVVFRHSTAGLLFCLSFLLAWLITTAILHHEAPWLAARIPDLLLRPFGSDLDHMRLIPHAAASILERLAILPLFPLLAHFFLRRAEV